MRPANKRFNKFRGTKVGALIIASVATLSCMDAMSAVISSGIVNIPIPATTAGIYINFVTNATGASAASTPGWDWNPYNTTTGLGFYWAPTPAGSFGAVEAAVNQAANLAPGALVSPASTFTNAIQSPNPTFRTTLNPGYVGVRFFNEATSAINYGWVQITTTATTGFPATIVRYAYENTGASITVGTTPVSLQSYKVD